MRREKRKVSPMAKRQPSNAAYGGTPSDGSSGLSTSMIPKSIRIGLWPRRKDFQAQSASPAPGAKWSVSLITTFVPSLGGGSLYQRPLNGLAPGCPRMTSSKLGEIQSAG